MPSRTRRCSARWRRPPFAWRRNARCRSSQKSRSRVGTPATAARAAQCRRPRVLLWPDTFNTYFHSETARHALEVLEAAGYDVVIPERTLCCGRPLYDYGMLGLAKTFLRRIIDVLRPEIEAGTPIVVLEPSCASVFKDELRNLLSGRRRCEAAQRAGRYLRRVLERLRAVAAAAARAQRDGSRPLSPQGDLGDGTR